MSKSFTVPRVFFAFRNGQPRIVIDGLPHDAFKADAAIVLRFAAEASRASLIRFAQWNDRNADVDDASARRELGRVLTTDELREIVRNMAANI